MLANIAVLVSGGGTNLQALIDAQNEGGIPNGKLALVVSPNPTAYALERAKAASIPAQVIVREKGVPKDFEDALERVFEAYNIDLIVLAGFMTILSGEFTQRFCGRIINIHPSLIPAFCGKGYYGLKVHEAALSYGVKVTGATVHYVNEVPDGGQILLQKAVPVLEGDTPQTLQQRVMEQAEWELLPKAVEMVCREILQKGGEK